MEKIKFIPCSEDIQTYYKTKQKGKKKKGSYWSGRHTNNRGLKWESERR